MKIEKYIERYLKFLVGIQIIGILFVVISSSIEYGPFKTLLIFILLGYFLAYYTFKGLALTLKHYLISIALYLATTGISLLITFSDTDWSFLFFFWNIIFGFSLVIAIPARKLLPVLIRHIQAWIQEKPEFQSPEMLIDRIKKVDPKKVLYGTLVSLLIICLIIFGANSKKESRCSELRKLAKDYQALYEEHEGFAKYYQDKAEESVTGYGHVLNSVMAGAAYQLKSYGHSGNASNYIKKLKEVKAEMRELGCK